MGNALYVSPTGLDTNPGTLASPFKTIQRAVTVGSTAASTVFVRAGTYAEKVSIASGSSTLVVRNMPGEGAIIDGTGLTVANGQQGLIDIDSRSNLTIRGLEFRNFRSTNGAVPVGIYAHGAGSNLSVLGNHIHDIATTVGSCDGAGGNAFGLAVYGTETTPWTNVTVSENELDHLTLGCSESLSINGNVDGFVVAKNKVHDNDNIGIVAIGFEGTAPTPALDQARNGVIIGNVVYNITSRNNPAYNGETSADGIYVDGGTRLLIEGNVVHNADLGIEVASEHAGRSSSYVMVRSNSIYFSNAAGISVGGYAAIVGNADHDVFLNNTLFANTVELQLQFHVTEVRSQNNIFFSSTADYLAGSTTGLTQTTNLTRTGNPALTFVDPGAPPNGAIAVDLHAAATLSVQVVNQGTAFTCPAQWTCPAVWGVALVGTLDVAGSPRVAGTAIDLGAWEQ